MPQMWTARRCACGLFATTLIFGTTGCARNEVQVLEGSGQKVLRPFSEAGSQTARLHQVVYVPIYSSIYWGFDRQQTKLSATLSIRNVSAKHPIVIHSAKYFDSDGKQIREYVEQPGLLDPLATADFVIQQRDKSGGPGANFLVEWSSTEDVDEPVIEAIMLGQHGNSGISFTSPGRPLAKASSELQSTK